MNQDIFCPAPLTEEALTTAVETFYRSVRPERERLFDYYRGQQPVQEKCLQFFCFHVRENVWNL